MPHIYINESDNTLPGSQEQQFNVVYIPARTASAATDVKAPKLYTTVDEFIKEGEPGASMSATTLEAVMACNLLKQGFHVLYEVILTSADPDWKKLEDKGAYQIKFLTNGADADGSISLMNDTSSAHGMLTCAELRGDCIALVDHAKEITPTAGDTVADAIRDSFETALTTAKDKAKLAAAFSPWCEFDFGLKNASEVHTNVELPGSFAFLMAYASACKNNPNWYAAAGRLRGSIPNLVKPTYDFGEVDCRKLQARVISADGGFGTGDNMGFAINPICNVRPFGIVVWGNRTLNANTDGLVASSFLNVRNLCCDIKKVLYDAARKFTFEQNTDILWFNFCAEIRPLLDKALSGNGIKGYKIIKDSTNVKGRLKARVKIVPIEAVEDFELTLELEDAIVAE